MNLRPLIVAVERLLQWGLYCTRILSWSGEPRGGKERATSNQSPARPTHRREVTTNRESLPAARCQDRSIRDSMSLPCIASCALPNRQMQKAVPVPKTPAPKKRPRPKRAQERDRSIDPWGVRSEDSHVGTRTTTRTTTKCVDDNCGKAGQRPVHTPLASASPSSSCVLSCEVAK